jgi:3D (Asp-Asp-Asp) domain-containing protein
VLGPASPSLARLLCIVAAAFLVVVLPALGEPSQTASGLRLENAQLAAKSRSALLDLYSLDSQYTAARARLSSVHAQLAALRGERATLRRELEVARAGQKISERQLAMRLRQLYSQGDLDPIEVVFGATSITDAMTQLDNIHRFASQNNEVLAQLRAAQTRFLSASQQLAARTADVNAALRKAASTEASLGRTRAALASYVASLSSRQNLNDAQILRLQSQARHAQAKSQQLTGSTPAAAVAEPVATGTRTAGAAAPGGRTLTVTISGYALSGATATGIPVGWGVAAVDPRVIPLGTHLWVPGYGVAVAADVGDAIVGTRVDIWFPTVPQAQTWGLRTVTIALH